MTALDIYSHFEAKVLNPLEGVLLIDTRSGDGDFGYFYLTSFNDDRIIGEIEANENGMFCIVLSTLQGEYGNIIPYSRAMPEDGDLRNKLYKIMIDKMLYYFPQLL